MAYFFFIMLMAFLYPLILFDTNPVGNLKLTFKTICSIMFVLISITAYIKARKSVVNKKDKKFFYFMIIGFLLSLCGDFLLSYNQDVFNIGVLSFALAHIFYIFGFLCIKRLSIKDFIIFAIIFIASFFFIKNQNILDFKNLYNLVLSYTFIISFMLAKAFSLLGCFRKNKFCVSLIVLGSLLFFISDFILLFVIFLPNCPNIYSNANLIIYYLGQGLLALSLRKVNFKEC